VAHKIEQAATQTHTQALQQDTKELVAEFTGKESLNQFLSTLRILASSLRNDQTASEYLHDLKAFILETKDTEHVKTDEFKRSCRDLIDRGRILMDKLRYQSEVENFLNASDELLTKFKNDELVSELRKRAGILVEDLTYEDKQGNRHLDTQILGNIRRVIVPVLADALKYIPIPRIEDFNEKRDYVIDNLVICGYDVIPDNIFVHLESDSWVSVRELETQRSSTRLVLSLRNLRTEIKDIKFNYTRKQFPKMEESGLATLRIGGQGATLTITFQVDQKIGDTVARFSASHVDFNIDQMDIDFNRSTLTHDILVPMITGVYKRNLIHAIERAVEKNLGGFVNDIGPRLSEAVVGTQQHFTKQVESMTDSVKRGEFARTFQKRQEKLSE